MSTPANSGAVVTIWFVTAADPAAVIASEPRSDRGFGRKYLAQLNPAWPITPIGQFALNRSVPASAGEYYIAGYPGITLVQTVIEDAHRLSELDPRLLTSLPANDVYVFATDTGTDFGGIAHFREGEVIRSLCARRDRLYEDIGLPDPFELPFWAGDHDDGSGTGIDLPFHPVDLVPAAQRAWLGFDIAVDGPDLHVTAFAVDGRPEPRFLNESGHRATPDLDTVVGRASSRLGISVRDPGYDDYETHDGDGDGDEFRRLAEASAAAARRIGRIVARRGRALRATIGQKLRHTDRP
ncbi:hypothetical protein M0E87_06235 [Corynebacterium sp. CCM 9185]|uniref:Uncharacterized protein n=1 Tax=Corynebacterium marambiense TaxID=2765364 RepID=A0ABS0VT19_9CORY|nr:hypothetical protein [Corynebacterium marambiense]MCK7663261.1 hypothetical protein [Corynebacterium marambiense]